MKHFASWSIFLLAIAGVAGADAPAKSVLAPTKRVEVLKLAARVLEPRTPTWKTTTAALPDPFYRTNFVKVDETVVAEPAEPRSNRSDAEILDDAAAQIRPAGALVVGTENYLLLGGKRVKSGDNIKVTVDGIIYDIGLSAVDRNSYTLRLNQSETRRQLK